MFKKFLADESGATAIEYGLIAALVSVAGIVALESMGQSLSTLFSDVSTKMQTGAAGGGGEGGEGGGEGGE